MAAHQPGAGLGGPSGDFLRGGERRAAGLLQAHLDRGQERWQILARQGLVLDGPLLPAGRHAGPDDVLDAAIAAWSARRLAAGTGQTLPARPEEMTPGGRPMAIWA